MNLNVLSSNEQAKSKKVESNNIFAKVKSSYILQQFFNILDKKKSLEIIKYNKYIQKRLNINTKDYKDYSEIFSAIEIEIIPDKG